MYFAFGGFLKLQTGMRHDVCIGSIARQTRILGSLAPRLRETDYILHSQGLTIAVSAASRG